MNALWAEAIGDGSVFLVLGVISATVLARALGAEERRRLRYPIYLTLLHLALLPAVAFTEGRTPVHEELRLAALLAEAMAIIGIAGTVLFGRLLPLIGLHVVGLLRDLVMAIGSAVAAFTIARRLGFDLHGIIATSAVITAIVGFSLQDVLGNVMGGITLQLDGSLSIGDWVKLNDVSGRVVEIRWRYTVVETRNGDTVLVPNSMLTKGQVTVLARSAARPNRTRRWVWFNVDFRFQPTDVIGAVENALRGAPIPGVASDAPITCVLMDLGESYARYAVRYWLSDLVADDPTDGEVRTRIYFALARAGIPLSMPARAVFVTEDTSKRRVRKEHEQLQRRQAVLAQLELFSHLSEADRVYLSHQMRAAPFARGEIIHRQGAEAHWLYVLFEGVVEERMSRDGVEEVVCRLEAPGLFGETSLMTGTPRAVTVMAVTDVECYRLGKQAFEHIMRQPSAAEHMAQVLARRRVDLDRAQSELDQEAARKHLKATESDTLARIRSFFGVAG